MKINPANVLKLLNERYSNLLPSEITLLDKEAANKIAKILDTEEAEIIVEEDLWLIEDEYFQDIEFEEEIIDPMPEEDEEVEIGEETEILEAEESGEELEEGRFNEAGNYASWETIYAYACSVEFFL